MKPKAKIIATIGPATNNEKAIKRLINGGVNVFRLNFSYGTYEEHAKTIDIIRKHTKNNDVAIMQDICGPKVRITNLENEILVSKNDTIKISKNPSKDALNINYPEIINQIDLKDIIYFADGRIKANVIKKENEDVVLKVLSGGILKNGKGVDFPSDNINLPTITEKDIKDLAFGSKYDVDLVAVSFVKDKEDILNAKNILRKNGSDAWVIAKIERRSALDNLDEIIDASDGVMVARGDLGVDIGLSKVPIIKMKIIHKANEKGIPVIVATQMLTSMINSPYPTRAEVSDIANAVLYGADAVMLSDETAIGHYYKEAVNVLKSTILETQKIYPYYKDYHTKENEIIAHCASQISQNIHSNYIVSVTATGFTAKQISKFRPKKPIIAIVFSEKIGRRLSLVWGIEKNYKIEKTDDENKLIEFISNIKEKTPFVLTMGSIIGKQGATNMVRIFY